MQETTDSPETPSLSGRPTFRWDMILFLGVVYGGISVLLATVVAGAIAIVTAGNWCACGIGFLATWLLAILALCGYTLRNFLHARIHFYSDRVIEACRREKHVVRYADIGHIGFCGRCTLQLYTPGLITASDFRQLQTPNGMTVLEVMRIDLHSDDAQQAFDIVHAAPAKSGANKFVSYLVDDELTYSGEPGPSFDLNAKPVKRLHLRYRPPGTRLLEYVRVSDIQVDDEPTPAFHLLESRQGFSSAIVCAGDEAIAGAPIGRCILAGKGTDLLHGRRYDMEIFTGGAVLVGRGCVFRMNPLNRKRRLNEFLNEYELLGHAIRHPVVPPTIGYYVEVTIDEQIIGRIQMVRKPCDYEISFNLPTGLLYGLLLALVIRNGDQPMGYPHWRASQSR